MKSTVHSRGISALMCALLVVVAAPPPGASSATMFTFFGSGSGHAVGLSQWGAHGLALKGWSRHDILQHFYQGTEIEQAFAQPDFIRVGLIQQAGVIHLGAMEQDVSLRLGSSSGALIDTIPAGEAWTVSPVDEQYEIREPDGSLVGSQLWGGPAEHIFATYEDSGGRLQVQETGHGYNRGHIELNLYADDGGMADTLRLIAILPLQDYLYGVSEVPSSWPQAALRAQADASRTLALHKIEVSGQNQAFCNCAVVASNFDQVYAGWDKEGGEQGERWIDAVDTTWGEVITYEGALINALFHSSSGGFTENSENVFLQALDYLRGVCDPGDHTANNSNRLWTEGPIDASTLTTALAPYTGDIGTITRFSDSDRGVSGRIIRITVQGTEGDAQVTGHELRVALSLRSTRFTINRDVRVTGAIRTEYDSLLCQPGLATTPAKEVPGGRRQRFENGAIYRNAEREKVIWLSGPAYDKYVEVRESAGDLGMAKGRTKPLSEPVECLTEVCEQTRFENGHIYLKVSTGAFELHGPVLTYYLSIDGPSSTLGFPISDVREIDAGGSVATFEQGKIRCNRSGNCRTVV
jgi:SpoIID/LytB domain protein